MPARFHGTNFKTKQQEFPVPSEIWMIQFENCVIHKASLQFKCSPHAAAEHTCCLWF